MLDGGWRMADVFQHVRHPKSVDRACLTLDLRPANFPDIFAGPVRRILRFCSTCTIYIVSKNHAIAPNKISG